MNMSLLRLSQQATLFSAFLVFGMSTSHAEVTPSALAVMESQSPIDFRPDSTYFGRLPALNFSLSSDTPLDVINNGSTEFSTAARANVNPGAGSLTLSGHDWELAQFHFHTPSEHLRDGQANPMEMHLVFSDSNNDLLVVGRWVQAGAFNNDLDPIFSHIPQNTSETLHIDHFNLNTLIPASLESFRYSGSLTTPPFSEGVSWVMLSQPLFMSSEQINAFSSLFPEGDARGIQDLNGRIVLTDVPGFVAAVPEPETYAMMLAGLCLMAFVAGRKNKPLTSDVSAGSVA
ncbi:MAG: carbonate dehydratase [Nitrosomonadales bacterium SCN 54-20]|nr:MAG: carbonate dehydratase [Nitrosomonadales bacterium SCN 54-20]